VTVDVVATRSQERLYLHVINTEFEQVRRLVVRLDGFEGLSAEAVTHTLQFQTQSEFDVSRCWTRKDTGSIPLQSRTLVIEVPPRCVKIVRIDLK
jgi:alpha-L-arabinofuranosidase